MNTCILLIRAAEAKGLGEQLTEARDKISKLSQHVDSSLEITLHFKAVKKSNSTFHFHHRCYHDAKKRVKRRPKRPKR